MPAANPATGPMLILDRHEEAQDLHEFHGGAVRRRFNPRSEEVWDYARIDFSSGRPADEVCRVYGLAVSTLKARARREGWRRKDLTETDPVKLRDESDIEAPPAPPTPELIDLAWRLMAEAMAQGRTSDTKSWLKVWRDLTAIEDKAGRKADAAAFKARMAAVGEDEVRASRRSADASLLSMTNDCAALDIRHPEERPDGTRLEGRERPVQVADTLAPVLDSLDSKKEDELSPLDGLNRRARRRLNAAQAKAARSKLRADRQFSKLAETLAEF